MSYIYVYIMYTYIILYYIYYVYIYITYIYILHRISFVYSNILQSWYGPLPRSVKDLNSSNYRHLARHDLTLWTPWTGKN